MIKIVAIYIPDVRYEQVPVFKLNEERSKFIYGEFEYNSDTILIDYDWEAYSVDGEDYAKLNKYELNHLLGNIVNEAEIDSE